MTVEVYHDPRREAGGGGYANARCPVQSRRTDLSPASTRPDVRANSSATRPGKPAAGRRLAAGRWDGVGVSRESKPHSCGEAALERRLWAQFRNGSDAHQSGMEHDFLEQSLALSSECEAEIPCCKVDPIASDEAIGPSLEVHISIVTVLGEEYTVVMNCVSNVTAIRAFTPSASQQSVENAQ